jgi:hypothetical protein
MAEGGVSLNALRHRARVGNVKQRSLYACVGRKKFYSQRASCASVVETRSGWSMLRQKQAFRSGFNIRGAGVSH